VTDKFCQEVLKQGSMFGHKVMEDGDGRIVCVVERVGMANTYQVMVPECLRKRVLELVHHPQASVHPGMSRLFWSLRTRLLLILACRDYSGLCAQVLSVPECRLT
jgi:hypothetical protein